MAVITPIPKTQFIGADGVPLAGGKVYTYAAGTTTPQATYTDSTGTTANTNPIILDSRGEANIWLGEATYKFKLTDENNVEIWTVDYISAPTTALSPVLTGNVTISTDSSGPALKVTQTGTGDVMRVQDSVDPDITPFVINSAGFVGLGTVAPAEALDIDNDGKIQFSSSGTARMVISSDVSNSTLDVKDNRNLVFKTNGTTRVSISGAGVTTISGGLAIPAGGIAITGNSTFTGTLGVSSTLTVSSGGLIVSAGGAAITGNSAVTGTFGVSGALTASGGLGVSSGLTVSTGGLAVSTGGAAIVGNTTVTGTLGVSSTLTASSGLAVTTGGLTVSAGGLAVSANGAAITGNSTVTGTLGVSSTLTISAGGLAVSSGGAAITGNSAVTGTFGVTSTLTASNQLIVSTGGANITGNSIVTGTLGVTSTLTASNGLTVSAGGASITGNTTVSGTLTATAFSGPWADMPSGTVMLFVQTAAPTGWTKSTTYNDRALRVVSGTASAGGSVAFTTAFASQSVSGTVGSYTLTTADIPSHTHTATVSDPGHFHAFTTGGASGSGYASLTQGTNTSQNTDSKTTGITVSNSSTGGGGGHTHSFTGTAINLAVQYVDAIIATKN